MDALEKKLQKVVHYVQKTPFLSIVSTPEGHGIQEVSGSIPLISTNTNPWKPSVSKDYFALGGNRAQHRGKLLTTFLTTLNPKIWLKH